MSYLHYDTILHRVKGTTRALLEFFASRLTLTHTGYADYQHADGTTDMLTDTWTDVPNNQLGDYTTEEFLPKGITSLMDPATGYLDFSQLSLGDWIHVRNDFTVVPDSSNAHVEARYEFGSGAGVFYLYILDSIGRGAAAPVQSLKGDIRITMSFPSTLNNPGKLQVKCDVGGTLTVQGSNVGVTLSQARFN